MWSWHLETLGPVEQLVSRCLQRPPGELCDKCTKRPAAAIAVLLRLTLNGHYTIPPPACESELSMFLNIPTTTILKNGGVGAPLVAAMRGTVR